MKKTTLFAIGLISASILGGQVVKAATPVTAKSDATVTLQADDGSEETESGNGPGGGTSGGESGNGGGGEIIKPPAGEEGGEGGVVNPGQTTPMRLSLLTAFDFGTIKISGNTEVYDAQLPTPNFTTGGEQERPNFVQVTDNRGNNAGWSLTAKISKQFTNGTSTLTGSKLSLNNAWAEAQAPDLAAYTPTVSQGVVLTTDASSLIATAPLNKGMGTWNILYGTLNPAEQATKGDARKSVTLEIPGTVSKTEGAYTAEIDWTLNNTPAS